MVELCALCGQREDPLLTLHPAQQSLGATDEERGLAYRAILAEAMTEEDLAHIRVFLQQQRAYGRDEFQRAIEARTQRFAGVRPAPIGRVQSPHGSEPDPVWFGRNLTPFGSTRPIRPASISWQKLNYSHDADDRSWRRFGFHGRRLKRGEETKNFGGVD